MDKKYIDIFKETLFTKTTPGSLIADVELLLAETEQAGIPLSKKSKHITMGQLIRINESLTTPLIIKQSRPTQKSFPNINGLYILLRNSGLVKVRPEGKKLFLVTHEPAIAIWKSLNAEEKYASLFKLFFFDIQNRDRLFSRKSSPPLYLLFSLFETLSSSPLKVRNNKAIESKCTYLGTYFLTLMDMFGLITIAQAETDTVEKWFPKSVAKTPLGEAFVSLLQNSLHVVMPTYVDTTYLDTELIKLLSPLMPEVKSLLPGIEDSWGIFRDGLYTFLVTLQKASCRITIPAAASFSTFAQAILDAFHFANDHLHMFKFENAFGVEVEIFHEESHDGYSSTETTIGELSLNEGDTLEFIFDFGDWWEFGVVLERIDKPDGRIKQPKITACKGTPPEQYDYDDEEWL